MALVVFPSEDWDSLVSVDFSDTYHANYGNAQWAALASDAKEAALRRATQYIMGRRVLAHYLNPLHWNVKAATVEAALRAADGSLYADVGAQAVVSETVGPISTTYAASTTGGRMTFPVIDDLLRGLTDGAWNVRLERG
jgi:hypothetical protein